MNGKNKKMIYGTVAAVAVLVLVAYWLFLAAFSMKAGNAYIYIDEDDTPDSVYVKLDRSAQPSQLLGVKVCGTLLGYKQRVRTGRYQVGGGLSSLRIMRNLRGGIQEPVKLVVPVTHTMNTLAGRLSRVLLADSASLAQAFASEPLLRGLEVDKATVPCLFVPNTYEVYWDITPEALLKRMKREHDAFWTPERKAKAAKAGLTPNEAYTLASIVEQESANEKERPMIAGMYLNRLRQGMKLQADPTVKFALGNFALRRILHVHLTVDSPYNTYRRAGLPPGPICIPSRNAILSVLDFVPHKYLYMCAKEDFSGTHNFAETYEEHLANARRYTAALNARGVK